MKANPILLEVFKNRFISVAEEMGMTLNRTAFSPNIKERRDYSCAVFDSNGNIIAQAAHIPVHLGSMPMSVKAAIECMEFNEGDMVMVNDPFKGGTHLPDITIIAPVFIEGGKPVFYVANRAHHSDVGGISAGSMPLSTSLYQEGIIIPALKIVEGEKIDKKIMALILNNVRTPQERQGDFSAQIMANHTGVTRLKEIVSKYTLETTAFYARQLIDYSERIMRKTIEKIPDGCYEFEDIMDDDGHGTENIAIRVKISVNGDSVIIDFTHTDDQVKGSINAVYSITASAVLYVFRCLVKENIPTNAGCVRPLKIITRKGSIVDAKFPAAVAGGNVETSQRIVDVLLGALAIAIPEKIPAASQGTMNNITIGGFDTFKQKPFAYYETIGGGMGATRFSDGEMAVHSHMTNTMNTPIEALEYAYPLRVMKYMVRKDSGGEGKHRGGNGIIREIQLLEDSEVTVLSERRKNPPYGFAGGSTGMPGKNTLSRDGVVEELPGKFSLYLEKGAIITIETPGGGGYGFKEE